VRTAALVNGPAALRLLAGYASDPRDLIQFELGKVWHYFDAEEYAKSVLADAPLRNGAIWLDRRELLGSVKYLTNLTKVILQDLRSGVDDLDWIRGVPCLDFLNFATENQLLDLTPLREHQGLTKLWIQGKGISGGFDIFDQLPNISETYLRLGDEVRSVDFLTLVPNLERLWLVWMPSVESLAPVRMLGRLKRVDLSVCKTDPVPVVLQCPSLTELHFSDGSLGDGLSRIKEILPRLTRFGVEGASIGDSASLASLTQADFVKLGWSTHPDLRPMVGLSKLRHLLLMGCGPEVDVSPLAALPHRLTIQVGRGDGVRGIDAVRGRHRIIWR